MSALKFFVPAIVGLFISPGVHALPVTSLIFRDRIGTATPLESIDVWVTFRVDPSSAPFFFDAALGSPFGLDPADLPTEGGYTDPTTGEFVRSTFDTYTSVQTTSGFVCGFGNFTAACSSGPPYDFVFHSSNADPTRPSFNFRDSLSIDPGESRDYLFGSFVPSGGLAPVGTYSFYGAVFLLDFTGRDSAGHLLRQTVDINRRTCFGEILSDCEFVRSVVAIPEPPAHSLIGFGLLCLILLRRNQYVTDQGSATDLSHILWR